MKSLTIILILIAPYIIYGQPGFEGIIEYQVNSTGLSEGPESGSLSFFFHGKDLMIRTDISELPASRILYKAEENSIYMINDSAKYAIKLNPSFDKGDIRIGEVPEEFRQEYENAAKEIEHNRDSLMFRLELTGETQRIAGYDCKKYGVVNPGGQTESYVWVTRSIQITFPDNFIGRAGIMGGFITGEGFPLRIENLKDRQGQAHSMILEAKRILKSPPDPREFRIPDSYEIKNFSGIFK